MDNLLAFFLIDELLPKKGNSGGGGNGCGCLVISLLILVLYAVLSSVCSLIYNSCSSATQQYKERRINEQEIQRLKDYNEMLSATFLREFAERTLAAEGFIDLEIHDVYVTGKDSVPKNTDRKNEEWEYFCNSHHLEGDFHMDGDTAHFYFKMKIYYDYQKDVDNKLEPACYELIVRKRESYLRDIYESDRYRVYFAAEPYDSICKSHTALWHHLDSLTRDLLPLRIDMKATEYEKLERPLKGLERCLRTAGYKDGVVDTIKRGKKIAGLKMLLERPNKEQMDRAFRHAKGLLTGLGENKCPYSEKCGIWKVESKTIYLAKMESGIMVTISPSEKIITPWMEQRTLP